MRRIGLLGVVVMLITGTAALALPYRKGLYKSGVQTGTSKPGVRLEINAKTFEVQRISYREKCTAGRSVIRDEFNFIAGNGASLTGAVDKRGRFSGRYHSSAGTVQVSGQAQGGTASVKSSETNIFSPVGSTARYTCRASHTFHAKN